ncbi:hypothetical protein GCM10027396_34230 [Insolitispirillum peregrinum]
MFRWFVGLSMDAPIRDVTVFTKNRERLLAGDIAAKFMAAVLNRPRVKVLLSEDHFSVDGTLIEAWASMKSFKPKDAAAGGDDDATPPGTTGMTPPEAVGRSDERNFRGENRHALIIDATLAHATGTAGREAALLMLERLPVGHRITLAADAALPQAAKGKPLEIWWQDEARVGQQGTLSYAWAERGSRSPAPRDCRYTWAYIFGAVCPAREIAAGLVLPTVNIEAMTLHLAEVSRQIAPGAHAILTLDGAGWHKTGGAWWSRATSPCCRLLPLPPYAPELNPVENVWQYLRQNALSHLV